MLSRADLLNALHASPTIPVAQLAEGLGFTAINDEKNAGITDNKKKPQNNPLEFNSTLLVLST